MTFIRTFFDLNHDLILFVYGLVFFVLNLAFALQSRHYSRLEHSQAARGSLSSWRRTRR